MTPFTLQNWQNILTEVYVRAIEVEGFAERCVLTPREVVMEICPDFDLPPVEKFHFRFFTNKEDFIHSYLLPPYEGPFDQERRFHNKEVKDIIKDIIYSVMHCTQPTTGL